MIKYVPLCMKNVWIFRQDAGTTLAAVDEVKEYVSENTHYKVIYVHQPSLVPRPSPAPVFDRLQYAKTEPEGLVNLTT